MAAVFSKRKPDAKRLLYCGPEGLSIGAGIKALSRGGSSLPDWPQLQDRTVMPTFLGRTAVWQLCRIWNLGPGDEILIPAYNCGTEVDPFIVSGCKVTLYRVDERANIDMCDIVRRRSSRTKVVYVTHYFGWPQRLDELVPWCARQGLFLVEDCALALFSNCADAPLGTVGDAAIFSLGKFLPVPAGGLLTLRSAAGISLPPLRNWPKFESIKRTLVLIRNEVQRKSETFGFYSELRRMKMRMARRGQALEAATSGGSARIRVDMPKNYYVNPALNNKRMPPPCLRIVKGVNPADVIRRRRANYLELHRDFLNSGEAEPLFDELPAGTCPMAFPVLSPERQKIVHFLEEHGVCSYPFWEGYHRDLDWSAFPEARMLKDNLLTLPVNQSLSVPHMHFIARMFSDAQNRGAPRFAGCKMVGSYK